MRDGRTGLATAACCAGVTTGGYAHYGMSISRTSRAPANNGARIAVSDLQPGDLIFYASGGSIYHVAMYIGGGQIIHAIDEAHGIGISSLNTSRVYCAVSIL